MFIYLYVCAAFLPPIILYCFVVSYINKCKSRLFACYTCIGDFSLAHSILEQKCTQLESIKSVTRCNAVVGRNGLPYVFGAKRDWGEPFSIYTSPAGGHFHLRYGCCGATQVQHLYTLRTSQLDEKKFCSKCNKNLHPKLLPFLRLYHECKSQCRKENTACNLLKRQIFNCDKGMMRVFCWKEIKRIKSVYQKMLSDKKSMQDELCMHFRKGYLGLRDVEFYPVCQSQHPGAGTNPDAPFIAALKLVPYSNPDGSRTYQILRLGFPHGGYILYKEGTYITTGQEVRLLGIDKTEKDARYVYLPVDSRNLLHP